MHQYNGEELLIYRKGKYQFRTNARCLLHFTTNSVTLRIFETLIKVYVLTFPTANSLQTLVVPGAETRTMKEWQNSLLELILKAEVNLFKTFLNILAHFDNLNNLIYIVYE